MTRSCSSSCAPFLAAYAAVVLGCTNRPLGDARADAAPGFPPGGDMKLDAGFAPKPDAPAPAPTPGPVPTTDGGFGPPPSPTPPPGPVPRADGGFGPPPSPTPPPGPVPRADGGFGPPPAPTPPPGPVPRADGGFGPPGPGPAPTPGPAPVPPKCAATTCAAGTICCEYQCGAVCVQGTSCGLAPGMVVPCGLCNVDTDCSLANSLCSPGGPCECRTRSRWDVVAPLCAACNQPGMNACTGKTAACVQGKCVVR